MQFVAISYQFFEILVSDREIETIGSRFSYAFRLDKHEL